MSRHTRPPQHSVTAAVIAEMQLYGYRPHDEPDPRPLPDAQVAHTALIDIFDAVVSTFADTRLEPDVEELLWSVVNLFHRAGQRAQRRLDDNEDLQRRGQDEHDGSEVRSVELERLTAEGISLIEKRNTFDVLTDLAAELFEQHTGSAWRPLAGSKVNHKNMTAALIDSRDFIAAKRRAETEIMLPQGTRIAFSGGAECNDHKRIWDTLDKTLARYPDMVLLHGATPKGAERIAACWAESRKVTQDSLQARLDEARQGRSVPPQRSAPRHDAEGRHHLPRLRHHRKPRRQGQEARHSGLAVRHGRLAADRQPDRLRRPAHHPMRRAVSFSTFSAHQ